MAQHVSIFQPYSVGQVTVPKERTSRHIQAVAVEIASATDGEVTHAPEQELLKGFDNEGTEYEVKMTSTRDIECEWLPMEGNRATPPDVERGELVMIYRLGDTTQYYWTCMGLRNHRRTLESVITFYGATPDLNGCGLDFAKCYYQQWSPLDGHVTFGTSQANGEKFKYTFQINTKDSFIALTDDIGNYLEINSAESRVILRNVDDSYFKAEKKVIDIKADAAINITVGGTTMVLLPDSITSTATTITETGTTNNRNATTINDNAPTINVTTTKWSYL